MWNRSGSKSTSLTSSDTAPAQPKVGLRRLGRSLGAYRQIRSSGWAPRCRIISVICLAVSSDNRRLTMLSAFCGKNSTHLSLRSKSRKWSVAVSVAASPSFSTQRIAVPANSLRYGVSDLVGPSASLLSRSCTSGFVGFGVIGILFHKLAKFGFAFVNGLKLCDENVLPLAEFKERDSCVRSPG